MTHITKVWTYIVYHLFSKRLLVSLNQLLESSLGNNLSNVTFKYRRYDVLNVLDGVSKKLGACYLKHIRFLRNRHIRYSVNHYVDSILGRNLVTRRKVYLNVLKGHIIHSLYHRNHNLCLTNHSRCPTWTCNYHCLVRWTLFVTHRKQEHEHKHYCQCNSTNYKNLWHKIFTFRTFTKVLSLSF